MPGRGVKSAATALTAFALTTKHYRLVSITLTGWTFIANPIHLKVKIFYTIINLISVSGTLIVNQSSQTKIKAILIKK